MKKLVLLTFTIMSIIGFSTFALASSNPLENDVKQESATTQSNESIANDKNSGADTEDEKMSPAGEEIVDSISRKDQKIKELTIKYNDKTLGLVAYYLEIVRYYSTPIFFIFLTIGAFNFFIVGNKKLDKKEQGFGWISACIIGWVFFQCIPLIFTLLTLRK